MRIFLNKLKFKFSLKNLANEKVCHRYRKDEDSWAIITGCTSGIGKAYAEFLYHNNFKLILISRNEEKLNHLGDHLKESEGKIVKVKMDFSSDDLYSQENYKKYSELFSKYKISLLVNNVGETTFGGDFYKYDVKKNKSIVNVNINSNVFITKLFIDSQMNKSGIRRGIINISSYFGKRPVPGVSIYSSTKAFISNFSECLYYELKNIKDFQVDILCINPLFVKTNMVRKWNNKQIIQPEELVYSSFIKINRFKVRSYGHWKHSIQSIILNLIPNFIFCRFSNRFYTKQHELLFERLKKRRKNAE